MKATNDLERRLEAVDHKRGRVTEWARLQVDSDIAKWIVVASDELERRAGLILGLTARVLR